MSETQVAPPAPTIAIQRAGDGHVVVTLYANEDRVADLAWRLSQLAQAPSPGRAAIPSGERDFYRTVIDGMAKGSVLIRQTLQGGPAPSAGPGEAPRAAAPLRDRDFELWLERHYKTPAGKPMDRRSVQSRISNCRHVAEYEGSLDEHFDRDEMVELLHKFEFGRKDQKQGRRPRHSVPIDGDLTSGTATLKSAIVLYAKFCRAWPKGDPAPTP